jgi:hypothetical protein
VTAGRDTMGVSKEVGSSPAGREAACTSMLYDADGKAGSTHIARHQRIYSHTMAMTSRKRTT